MKLTKSFKYSINGYQVETFEAGDHDELHPDVVAYAKKIGALENGEGDAVEEKASQEPEQQDGTEPEPDAEPDTAPEKAEKPKPAKAPAKKNTGKK